MRISDLQTRRIAILGLGVNNYHLAAYLLRHGCAITIREQKEEVARAFEQEFSDQASKIQVEIMPDVTKKLQNFDVVFRTPQIPYLSAGLRSAEKKGVLVYSQTKLFFDLCPAQIVGITGTKGKGTTAKLTYELLEKGYREGKVYLAGNIGVDPFSFLDELTESDVVILELSSFQLQDLQKSPPIAVLLTVGADHLDHHRNLQEYHYAKANILAHQQEEDVAIISGESAVSEQLAARTPATVYRYRRHTPARQAAWSETLDGQEVVFYQIDSKLESFPITGRKLVGDHNLENILPAVLVAAQFQVPVDTMREIVQAFTGLEHRLSFLGEYQGISFYDDSIATTPESCAAALQAFPDQRVHLIAGGRDKGQDYAELALEIAHRCATVSLLPGKATARLRKAISAQAKRIGKTLLILDQATDPVMETVMSGIVPHLQPGDVVLLAPAAASDHPFANYHERGLAFQAAVEKRYQGA